ncbi:hypothetical protein GBA52_010889 [Prunus armeniaca]|nr:hypothetical protein GBA52_010889 [Prunus armeniaca]
MRSACGEGGDGPAHGAHGDKAYVQRGVHDSPYGQKSRVMELNNDGMEWNYAHPS